ncbi:MAG: hypothetical protein ACM359_17865, partial [Bacillota bacterium]
MKRVWITGSLVGTLLIGAGCFGTKGPERLKAQAFYQAQTRPATQPSDALVQQKTTVGDPNAAKAAREPEPATPKVSAIDPALPTPLPAPQTGPAPVRGDTTGGFMLVGTVVAEANGQAIYA